MYASSAYIELTYIGQSNSQEIGKLLGNAFTVTLRNLSGADAEAFSEIHKRDYAFLNYYDYQRFGIPGYPQVTHLLGKALLDQDYQRAFKLYRLSGNTKIDSVKDPEKFFTSDVDARKLSFFKNAYSSSIWNNELMYLVQRSVPNTVIDDSTGITYRFCKNLKDVLLLLRQGDNLPYLKYDVQGSHQSERSLITHTRVECLNTSDDERHANCKTQQLPLFCRLAATQQLLYVSFAHVSCIKERTPSSAAHGSYQMNSQTATYPVVSIQSKLSTVVLLQ